MAYNRKTSVYASKGLSTLLEGANAMFYINTQGVSDLGFDRRAGFQWHGILMQAGCS